MNYKEKSLNRVTKKVLLSLMLVIVILLSSFNSAFASSTSQNKDNFTVTVALIEEFAASLTEQELSDNPYLVDLIEDMNEIVNDSKDISFTELNSQLHERVSFTNQQSSRLEKNELITQNRYTQEDEEQLKRVDQLAQ